MHRAQLAELCEEAGAKPLHTERLIASIFRHGITDPDAIPDIPNTLRQHLRQYAQAPETHCIADHKAEDGTRKLLLAMPDGREVETVLIPGPARLTQCISSQVGCAMGCTFCLTATAGLTRNLTAAEMVAQVRAGQQSGTPPRNLVLMGMGEPLHNYREVARFIRIVTDPLGMAFSPRRVTISTAGLVPGIRQMLEDELPCNLAVSLNATTDAVRERLMPVNRRWPMEELIAILRDYVRIRGDKRILIEYVMLKGINDTDDDARRLLELLANIPCTINLLPFNPFSGSTFRRPDDERVSAFRHILVEAGRIAVVRESKGQDIYAACGQLKTAVRQRSNRFTATCQTQAS
ncbi:MAG TPA: 23S rRNA (adenine(2503)-C(2))-methyltransferase RlmN [Mariprofundaceae bacterium]|nr:23S rRNA (adenine(2503)-C(2))-methyltransferase RlmN [Mariprofundaceae bacterium]